MRELMRFIVEEDGRDLIEYALLTMALGMCAVAAFELWSASISGTYNSWNATVNDLWDPEPK